MPAPRFLTPRQAYAFAGTTADEEIDTIIAEIDKDGNGEIDYQEFCDVRHSSLRNNTCLYFAC